MYLKAIELHGFKSFPDKTKIEFEKGMSVVVGPNGSGKSNISDAIRWVLGETRGSQLRAGAKMEDIIFGGTQKRAPMGFASVSLILDNSDRDFDVDSDEIAVMRKYYRGGDSEYYINGARVRLKDIQEANGTRSLRIRRRSISDMPSRFRTSTRLECPISGSRYYTTCSIR